MVVVVGLDVVVVIFVVPVIVLVVIVVYIHHIIIFHKILSALIIQRNWTDGRTVKYLDDS